MVYKKDIRGVIMSEIEYPVTYEEFVETVIELYLNEYPEDKRKIVLDRLYSFLKGDSLKRLYEHTCRRFNRRDSCKGMSKYDCFKSLMVNTLQFYIGGNFDNKADISDLKKIEENFKVLINDFFLFKGDMGDYEYHFPELTDDLYINEDFNRVPGMYGGFFYFLKLEDGKPILYANASSRMDMDELYIIDVICYRWIKDGRYDEEISKTNIKMHW